MASAGGRGSLGAVTALLPRYRVLLAEAERWFAGAAAAYPDPLQCRRGCDACCRGLFDITPLDAIALEEAYDRADAPTQRALRHAARRVIDVVREAEPGWGSPWRLGTIGPERFDALCDTLDTVPCPALAADGSCLVYADRPLVCRLHGLPMYDPGERRDCGGACVLNPVPDDLAAHPQYHFGHEAFARRELELLAEATAGTGLEHGTGDREAAAEESGTLVAAAILAAAERHRGRARSSASTARVVRE